MSILDKTNDQIAQIQRKSSKFGLVHYVFLGKMMLHDVEPVFANADLSGTYALLWAFLFRCFEREGGSTVSFSFIAW